MREFPFVEFVVAPSIVPQAYTTLPSPFGAKALTPKDIIAGKSLLYKGVYHPVDCTVIQLPIASPLRSTLSRHRSTAITKVILHTNDGAQDTSLTKNWDHFQQNANKDANSAIQTHFAVDKQGNIAQYHDMAVLCYHASLPDTMIAAVVGARLATERQVASMYNNLSVSIEVLVPKQTNVKVKNKTTGIDEFNQTLSDAQYEANLAAPGAWPRLSPFYAVYVTSTTATEGRRKSTLPRRYAPTNAQKDSIARLLRAIKKVTGVVLRGIPTLPDHPGSMTRANDDIPKYKWFTDPTLGVFHHCQLENNRVDVFGLGINEVLAGGTQRAGGD